MQEQKFYNLTNPQKSIWVTEEYFKGSAINNICGTALIRQKVNFDLLKKAINIVLENNDIFKIKFSLKNDIVTQYISDYVNSDIELLRAKNYSDFENQKKEIVSSRTISPAYIGNLEKKNINIDLKYLSTMSKNLNFGIYNTQNYINNNCLIKKKLKFEQNQKSDLQD